jgi:spore germination cell wall hydrolase CwlJ-like protein
LDKTTPSKDSLKAARAALSGENNVPGAVYFFNPKREPGKLKKVTVVKEFGHHVFAK